MTVSYCWSFELTKKFTWSLAKIIAAIVTLMKLLCYLSSFSSGLTHFFLCVVLFFLILSPSTGGLSLFLVFVYNIYELFRKKSIILVEYFRNRHKQSIRAIGPIVGMKNTIYALCKKLGSYVSILDELQTKVVSLWNSTFIPFGGVIWIFVYGNTDISVRAMQYVLDMTMNSKKPDDLVHKLPYKY